MTLRAVRAITSDIQGGRWYSGTAMASPGDPAGPCRERMFGGVRTDSHTFAAPPVAKSCAISMPDEPAPTTITRLPANGVGLR